MDGFFTVLVGFNRAVDPLPAPSSPFNRETDPFPPLRGGRSVERLARVGLDFLLVWKKKGLIELRKNLNQEKNFLWLRKIQ